MLMKVTEWNGAVLSLGRNPLHGKKSSSKLQSTQDMKPTLMVEKSANGVLKEVILSGAGPEGYLCI